MTNNAHNKNIKILLFLGSLICLLSSFKSLPVSSTTTERELENIIAFSKLYGYIRFFNPTDEAQSIDWDKLSIYGLRKVRSAENDEELANTLIEIFQPLAPLLHVSTHTDSTRSSRTIPPSIAVEASLDSIYWQYLGINETKEVGTSYKNLRVNRDSIHDNSRSMITTTISSSEIDAGKQFRLTAILDSTMLNEGAYGSIWLSSLDKSTNTLDFKEERIMNNDKKQVQVNGNFPYLTDAIKIGIYLDGIGDILVNKIKLDILNDNYWTTIYDIRKPGSAPIESFDIKQLNGTVSVLEEDEQKIIRIHNPDTGRTKLFEASPRNAFYEDTLIGKLHVSFPIVVVGDKKNTYPIVPDDQFKAFHRAIDNIDLEDLTYKEIAIAASFISWNYIQHFFPYRESLGDWDERLRWQIEKLLYSTITSKDLVEESLRIFLSTTNDGHLKVAQINTELEYLPPFVWEFDSKGEELKITHVLSEEKALQDVVGKTVEEIDGLSLQEFLVEQCSQISASTPHHKRSIAEIESLIGPRNSTLTLKLRNQDEINTVVCSRELTTMTFLHSLQGIRPTLAVLSDSSSVYIDLSKVRYSEFRKNIDQVSNAKKIIFDLRNYPTTDALKVLSHFIPQHNFKSPSWIQIPQIILPNMEQVSYLDKGWLPQGISPFINQGDYYFLSSHSSISYTETLLSFIKFLEIGTIIGEPSAGTNGNVKQVKILDQFFIRFTGLKVTKHDSTPHHGIGVIPDVIIEGKSQYQKLEDDFLVNYILNLN